MKRRSIILFMVVTAVVFSIYAWSSAPGIGMVDSGELTAVAWNLGIAHPTGYPLFALLGRLWLMLIPGSPDHGMVLLSALWGALACGILGLIAKQILDHAHDCVGVFNFIIAGILAVGIGLTKAAWTSVGYAEVYPMTWFLSVLIIWLSIGVERAARPDVTAGMTVLICYVWGLGFGNHFTILWFAPLILWAVVVVAAKTKARLNWMAFCAAAFMAGISINAFLVIRSTVEPVLDWGDPQTMANLVRHLSAWQYRVWMFNGDLSAFAMKFVGYCQTVPKDVGWLVVLLAGFGIVKAVRMRRVHGNILFVVWLLGTAYNMNYDIPDISSYFLTFYGPIFVLSLQGLLAFMDTMKLRFASELVQRITLVSIALLFVASSAASAGKSAVVKDDKFIEEFTRELFRTLPDSALVFQGNWDIQSPVVYKQTVEGVRKDIVMLDINLMQRSWYIKQQRRNHPEVFLPADREVSEFLSAVVPFENGRQFDGRKIEAAFVAMHDAIIRSQLGKRPVYIRDAEASGHPRIAAALKKIPGAYFLRISEGNAAEPVLNVAALISHENALEERKAYLLKQAAQSVLMQGRYAISTGDTLQISSIYRAGSLLTGIEPRMNEWMQSAQQFSRELRETMQ